MENKQREPGYYFVRFATEWVIARWDGDVFTGGSEYDAWAGHAFPDEIDERPIIRHEQLPATFNVKKGMGFERHLLENYYVALPPFPIPNAETERWVVYEKGVSIGKSGPMISPEVAYNLFKNIQP